MNKSAQKIFAVSCHNLLATCFEAWQQFSSEKEILVFFTAGRGLKQRTKLCSLFSSDGIYENNRIWALGTILQLVTSLFRGTIR